MRQPRRLFLKRHAAPSPDIDPPDLSRYAPERTLLTEVLMRSFNDALTDPLNTDDLCTQKERREAQQWLFEGDDEITPFSFLWICDNLGLSYKAIRDRCRQLITIRENLPGDRAQRKSHWALYLNNIDKYH